MTKGNKDYVNVTALKTYVCIMCYLDYLQVSVDLVD